MFLIHHLHGWRLYFIYTDDCYLVNKWSYVKKRTFIYEKVLLEINHIDH